MKKSLKYIIAFGFLFFISATAVYATDCSLHGVPQNGYPNYNERAFLAVTNSVRISPVDFNNYYVGVPSILQPSVYPAVAPLQWHYDLNRSAHFYVTDHANTVGCFFSHNSCDGTSFSTRILSFYTAPLTYLSENASSIFTEPMMSVQSLLLDYNQGAGCPAGQPGPDGSGCDGHRGNIMFSGYQEVGTGYATGPNGTYFAQDFARPVTANPICSPIAAASHLIHYTHVVNGSNVNSYDTTFWAPFYSPTNQAPQSEAVVVDGVSHPMSLNIGTAARGTYTYATPRATGCRSYHFEFRDASGALVRYPVSGELRTYGEGTSPNLCTEDYVAATPPPVCRADFNADGTVTVQDIFSFLQAWFSGLTTADIDHSGAVTVQDIFTFLQHWFAGC